MFIWYLFKTPKILLKQIIRNISNVFRLYSQKIVRLLFLHLTRTYIYFKS